MSEGYYLARPDWSESPDGQYDLRLVALYLAGDQGAGRALAERHARRIRKMGYLFGGVDRSDDMADFVQDVFEKVFSSLADFRGDCSFGHWVTTIAMNAAKDRRKRALLAGPVVRAMEEIATRVGEEGDPNAVAQVVDLRMVDPERRLAINEEAAWLSRALDRLPMQQCQALLLSTEGFRYEEISQLLKMPIGSVRSSIHRARKFLATLQKDGGQS